MSLEAAAGRLCVVIHDGRRYIVRAPTLATVLLASGLFPEEVAAFAKVAVENPAVLTGGRDVWAGVISDMRLDVSDGRAGEVLESCCALMGGGPGDVLVHTSADAELAVNLAGAVLSLCDVPKCFEAAGWGKVGKKSIEELESGKPEGWFDPGARNLEIGLYNLAKEFHCSPGDVMCWPFEFVVMTNEIRGILANPASAAAITDSAQDFPIGDPGLAAFGIVYEKVPAPSTDTDKVN